MNQYLHNRADWPDFRWSAERLSRRLATVRFDQGRLIGQMSSLGFKLRREAELETLTEEVVKSGNIEGENLDSEQVRSSIARRLGMDLAGLKPVDRDVDGVVEMMLDATQLYGQQLTADRLFGWHSALFPTGRSGMRRIVVGSWRDDATGPMQVVSGRVGREHVHFEAPTADRIDQEMGAFLDWFNSDAETDLLMKAAVAHLWFVTIHPFEDGNGRLGRLMISLQLLSRGILAQPLLHLSPYLERHREQYLALLKGVSTDGHWDAWLRFFLAGVHQQSEDTRARVGRMLELQDDYHVRLRGVGRSRVPLEALDLVLRRVIVSVPDVAAFAKCDYRTAKNAIGVLARVDIVSAIPDTYPQWWRAHELLARVYES
mgnify:CR=1 FL=1